MVNVGVEAFLPGSQVDIIPDVYKRQNVDRVNQLMQVVPENFTVLCGDDGLTVPFMACGASGLVSVTSHLLPGIMNSIVKPGLNQDMG